MEVPSEPLPLLAELESLTAERLTGLAERFMAAEDSTAQSTRRALARHLAMSPDTPGAISILAGQLALSEAMISWEAAYGLDTETAYAARAALLDMGLVICVAGMGSAGATALADPWFAAHEAGRREPERRVPRE